MNRKNKNLNSPIHQGANNSKPSKSNENQNEKIKSNEEYIYQALYGNASPQDSVSWTDFFAAQEKYTGNVNRSLPEVAVKSSRILLQLSATAFFFVVYFHLSSSIISSTSVLWTSFLSTAIGYIIFQWWSGERVPKEHLLVSLIYLVSSYELAPVLRTLTDQIATDTIYAMSSGMFAIHLITSDYGINGFLVSKTVAVNGAVLGAVCLASRMPSDNHSFALLTAGLEAFVLFPIFSRKVWDSVIALSLSVFVAAIGAYTVSPTAFLLFVLLAFAVVFLFPLAFITSLRFKKNIYGPWDEAVLTNTGKPPSSS